MLCCAPLIQCMLCCAPLIQCMLCCASLIQCMLCCAPLIQCMLCCALRITYSMRSTFSFGLMKEIQVLAVLLFTLLLYMYCRHRYLSLNQNQRRNLHWDYLVKMTTMMKMTYSHLQDLRKQGKLGELATYC